jgi:hypothetical protein
LDKFSFIKPPPFNNVTIITLVRLLKHDPSITFSINTKIGNLIVRTCYELGILYGLNSRFFDLLIHEFNKDPTNYIKAMHGRIVGEA